MWCKRPGTDNMCERLKFIIIVIIGKTAVSGQQPSLEFFPGFSVLW
jgi:hypothetical protein